MQAAQKALRQVEIKKAQAVADMAGLAGGPAVPREPAAVDEGENPATVANDRSPGPTNPENTSGKKKRATSGKTAKKSTETDRAEAKPPKSSKPPHGKTPAQAKTLFAEECSLCHELSDVEGAPPKSKKAVDVLISRMVDNGMDLEPADLAVVRWYLIDHYVKGR